MPTPHLSRYVSAACLFSAVTIVGCRSAASTYVQPDPERGGWTTRHLRGVPITVKVPTHLEVRVVERQYLALGKEGEQPSVLTCARRVELDVREKDEVFTVDAVRPGAGTLNYKATFNKQYFKTFDSKVEDKTIESITNAIATITPSLKNLAAPAKGKSSSADSADEKLPFIDHLVAVRVFDVHDHGLEAAVRDFLACYLCGAK